MTDPTRDARRWLITGATGQVGGALLGPAGDGVHGHAPTRSELDLTSPTLEDDTARLIEREGLSAVVNCAAYTAVDAAEDDEATAHAVNGVAPGALARAAVRAGVPIVHISTDYVFSGAPAAAPRREDDPVAPINAYGRTKLAGERGVVESGARYAILRTAWVMSPGGRNFLTTMLRLGRERELLSVVNDQVGSPTFADDLAAAVATVTRTLEDDARRASGVWHVANSGFGTWHEVASEVFANAARLGARVPRELCAIGSGAYPTRAERPHDSRLDTSKIARDFGVSLPEWRVSLARDVATAMFAMKERGQ